MIVLMFALLYVYLFSNLDLKCGILAVRLSVRSPHNERTINNGNIPGSLSLVVLA